ncbi:MAG TPA: SxtJ family membrane protein [Candidatus Omnitrophota bacterium]|nr:SxtJ family membrane protein [Candidatus Omnitrophota bacterium]HPS37685.1 SxtJ family membrane protein [Candidatus Omnitrophota bacterium]
MVIEEIKKIESTPKKLREFGLLVGGVFLAIGGLLWWRGRAHYLYFVFPGACLAAAGAVCPGVLKPLQKAWMTLAVLMGWVMTRVLMTLLFYIAITPIGLIMRLTGKDILDMRLEPRKPSYWNLRKKIPHSPADYEKQF